MDDSLGFVLSEDPVKLFIVSDVCVLERDVVLA